MTERVDFKLRHVVVATYRYRHEAELAAGFLDDAGIPYRLQIDDPALGMTITTPPTLWVRSVDLRAAREVLELPDTEISAREVRSVHSGEDVVRETPSEDVARRSDSSTDSDRSARLEVVRVERFVERERTRLTARERLIALLIGAGTGAVALLLPTDAGSPILATTLSIVAIAFGLVALLGRAPAPMAWLIRALSGSAP